jgi:hypothetical protein
VALHKNPLFDRICVQACEFMCDVGGAGTGVQLESYSLPAGKNAETRLRLGESLHARG